MDLPNEEVVNPFQSDEIFKDIFKNDKSNKIITNKGSKAHSKGNSVKSITWERDRPNTVLFKRWGFKGTRRMW